jgi:hypothetical protein
MTAENPKAPLCGQTRVLDVFALAGRTCAHTSNAADTAEWWHLWDTTGRDLGSTNRPELLGQLLHLAG